MCRSLGFAGESLVLALLFVVLRSSRVVAQNSAGSDVSAMRDQIMAQYAAWDRAQVAGDRKAFDRMLAPDFEVRVGARRISRVDFLSQTAGGALRNRGDAAPPRTVRFDSQILTLLQDKNEWIAVITEKIESEAKMPDGVTRRVYTLGVTRDGWRKDGDRWTLAYSEAIGTQSWFGGKPPLPNWDR